ncbi:MAG: hypothetical protein ACI88C_000104 [Acidimicrobiales bacterium]|jgi:hypothetical protein
MQRTARQSALRTAALVLFALTATACGAVVTASEQREAAVATGATPVPAPLDVAAPSSAAPLDATPPSSAAGHQYGASLDEWTETEQQQKDSAAAETTTANTADAPGPDQSEFPEIEWTDLIPAGSSGAEIIARFEERLDAIEPGSEEIDALYAEMQAEYDPEAVDPALAGKKVRLAGFVAPLTYDDDVVTEFLLVPTFGACIHVPPPPPNQTVMVTVDRDNGLTVDESWGAVWVEGTMVIESGSSDLGATSYRITDATSSAYTDF